MTAVRPLRVIAVLALGDNQFIKAEADRIGAAYVPPIAKSMTYDGVRPTAAGLKLWRERAGAVCPD
jgi:hypothetical protein